MQELSIALLKRWLLLGSKKGKEKKSTSHAEMIGSCTQEQKLRGRDQWKRILTPACLMRDKERGRKG